MTPDEKFDPFAPALRSDPYPVYRRFREREPVHRGVPPMPSRQECWYLFRYDDVQRALTYPGLTRRTGRSDGSRQLTVATPSRHLAGIVRRMLLFNDPPDHTRLRDLVRQAFPSSAEALSNLEDRIRTLADGLLDDLPDRGTVDLMEHYARPLPVLVMAGLMGIPTEDHRRIKSWSTDIVAFADVRRGHRPPQRTARATLELASYLREIIAEREANPADDMISHLIRASEDGERLSGDELLANCVLLVSAGHETTVNLIGNGLHSLLRHPEELEALRADTTRIGPTVEEMLRHDSPVQMTFRTAHGDVDIGGATIPDGATVAPVLGAANRDPAVFAEPDRFRPGRDGPRHIAFGAGVHVCLGSSLGRLEGRIAVERLLERYELLSTADVPAAAWSDNLLFRGLDALPVEVG